LICQNCDHPVGLHYRVESKKKPHRCRVKGCRCREYIPPNPTLVLANGEPPEHIILTHYQIIEDDLYK